MIYKLRLKMLVATISSLLIVLTIIMGVMACLNYYNIIHDADEILTILSQNKGEFPSFSYDKKTIFSEKNPEREHLTSPELRYELRYFYVILDSEGTMIFSNMDKIAAVDEATAIQYAQYILNDGKTKGFYGQYRFLVNISENKVYIFFLDCLRNLENFYSYMLNGIGVCATGVIAVLILLIFLSNRIVKPFVENYEKQKRFITDAGHELKTPLTIISTDAEVLKMDFGDNEWLNDIQNQTKRLADLTDSLILLSRMEENNANLKMEKFQLSELVNRTIDDFRPIIKFKISV